MLLFASIIERYAKEYSLTGSTNPWQIRKRMAKILDDMQCHDVNIKMVWGSRWAGVYNSMDQVTVKFPIQIRRLVFGGTHAKKTICQLAEVIVHELTHRYQAYTSNYESIQVDDHGIPECVYLKRPYEIDALSQSLAIGIAYRAKTWEKVVSLLQQNKHRDWTIARVYCETFGEDSYTYRKFLKRLYSYLVLMKENNYVAHCFRETI